MNDRIAPGEFGPSRTVSAKASIAADARRVFVTAAAGRGAWNGCLLGEGGSAIWLRLDTVVVDLRGIACPGDGLRGIHRSIEAKQTDRAGRFEQGLASLNEET